MADVTQVPPLIKSSTPFLWQAWWMRIVGVFYVFLFVATAILKLPIRVLGPEGTLEKAISGDSMARFVEDTWVILGLALGAIGLALLMASRHPARSKVLVWTVIGFEFIWGIISDLYQITRGHPVEKILPWIIIHIVIITLGFLSLRNSPQENNPNSK